ncbi:hypothetical protein H9P43_004565 [Blastocladiella emersonii ATCC 22665]|nr:hypothetical protein H9P43_004565 [Blastocladiella emersonii ATCC 22665]
MSSEPAGPVRRRFGTGVGSRRVLEATSAPAAAIFFLDDAGALVPTLALPPTELRPAAWLRVCPDPPPAQLPPHSMARGGAAESDPPRGEPDSIVALAAPAAAAAATAPLPPPSLAFTARNSSASLPPAANRAAGDLRPVAIRVALPGATSPLSATKILLRPGLWLGAVALQDVISSVSASSWTCASVAAQLETLTAAASEWGGALVPPTNAAAVTLIVSRTHAPDPRAGTGPAALAAALADSPHRLRIDHSSRGWSIHEANKQTVGLFHRLLDLRRDAADSCDNLFSPPLAPSSAASSFVTSSSAASSLLGSSATSSLADLTASFSVTAVSAAASPPTNVNGYGNGGGGALAPPVEDAGNDSSGSSTVSDDMDVDSPPEPALATLPGDPAAAVIPRSLFRPIHVTFSDRTSSGWMVYLIDGLLLVLQPQSTPATECGGDGDLTTTATGGAIGGSARSAVGTALSAFPLTSAVVPEQHSTAPPRPRPRANSRGRSLTRRGSANYTLSRNPDAFVFTVPVPARSPRSASNPNHHVPDEIAFTVFGDGETVLEGDESGATAPTAPSGPASAGSSSGTGSRASLANGGGHHPNAPYRPAPLRKVMRRSASASELFAVIRRHRVQRAFVEDDAMHRANTYSTSRAASQYRIDASRPGPGPPPAASRSGRGSQSD